MTRPGGDSGERYRSIVETAVDAIITIDEGGLIESVNPAGERMFGYRAHELVGRNVSMLMPEPDRSAHDAYIRRYLESGEPRIIGIGREVSGLRRDGTRFPMHLSVGEMTVGGRRFFTGLVRDITDRVRAEQELQRQRDFASALIAGMQDGLLVLAPDGSLIEVNPRFCEMTGFSREELVGRSAPLPYWPPEEAERLRDARDLLLREGGESDVAYMRRSGERFPAIVTTSALRDRRGRVTGWVATVKDVSERRRHEEALRASEAQLAAQRETQRMKDEFVALVSHELRTPLTSVMGYLDLVLHGGPDLDAETRELLTVAERNGQRLLSLVSDLLLLAQAEAGRLSLELRALALREVVEQALEAARPAAADKRIRLERELRGDPIVDADPGRLAQLLDNLLTNAIKFTPEGGQVAVSLWAWRDRARVVVSDDGPGIPEADLARLFEPFFRARRASADRVPGTGLGLAIAKAIADGHGGRIAVQSVEGGGATFEVDLPLASEPVGLPREATG